MISRCKQLVRGLAVATLLAGAVAQVQAQAQPWPAKPVRVILPFPAGGTGDGVLRSMQPVMQQQIGQPVVMENMVGGTGMVGQDYTARAAPDGYTFVVLSISGTLAYHQLGKTIDFARDFSPIAQIYTQYGLVVSNPNLPEMANIRSLRDLIAYAKANPGKLNYTSQGTGSIGHMLMERIKAMTGINVVHVAYRGAAPANNDLMAGHIQMMSTSLGAMPYIKSGRMRAISVGAPKRVPELPEVSTFIEEGLTGYVASSWLGLAGPPRLPPAIIERMANVIKATLQHPEVLAKLRALGTEPEFLPTADYLARVQGDFDMWGKVMKENNIKPD